MPRSVDEFLLNVRVADALDVLVVAALLYLGFGWLRHRAARAVLVGVVLVGLVYVLAQVLEMYLVLTVFRAGLTLLLFSLIVVYREDIRHAMERLSFVWPFPSRDDAAPADGFRQTLVESVMELAERSIGALVVLPGRHSLELHVRGGVPVDGRISTPLLLSIFDDETPGHDGAAILAEGRIDCICAHLPLSKNVDALGPGGTRHAAALGLSERCDALVIVVSEERGTVSIARHGRLDVVDGAAELEQRLEEFERRETGIDARRLVPTGRTLLSMAACLSLAVLLWVAFAFRVETVQRAFADVPVEIRNLPGDWTVEGIDPPSVDLTLVGPERAFEAPEFDRELRLSLDLDEPTEGDRDFAVTRELLGVPDGVELSAATPPSIRVRVSRVERAELPIRVTTAGAPPEGLRLVETRVRPRSVAVLITAAARDWNRELRTEPVMLDDLRQTETREVGLVLPDGVQLVDPHSAAVEVTLEIAPSNETE